MMFFLKKTPFFKNFWKIQKLIKNKVFNKNFFIIFLNFQKIFLVCIFLKIFQKAFLKMNLH